MVIFVPISTAVFNISLKRHDLSLLHNIQTYSGAHPASYPMDTGGVFTWVKRPEREADHLLSCNADVKNGGAIPLLPHVFMA
jgi:hypothetical protein